MFFEKIFTIRFSLSLFLLIVAYKTGLEDSSEKPNKMVSKFIKSDPKLLTVGIIGYTGKSAVLYS